MTLDEIREEKFNTTFDAIYGSMKLNKENYTIEKLEEFLRGLYTRDGDDWGGRGEMMDVTLAANIAACETLLAEWKEEKAAE